MALGQLKGSTSKTNPLTSSPKPVLPRVPGSLTVQDSVLEPGSYLGFRPALHPSSHRCPLQMLPVGWLFPTPRPLALPATTRLGALIVADLNNRNSLWPLPQPSPHLLESQASFHSAGLVSMLLRYLGGEEGG